MPTYAVTGASGQLGRLVIDELLTRGASAGDIIAVVRTPSKATDLAGRGVRVREGDYSRPATLNEALTGVDRLLLVSSNEPGHRVAQHTNVIEAARAAGVSRIAYTSMLNADHTTNPLAGEHQDTEQTLRAAGVPFTLAARSAAGSHPGLPSTTPTRAPPPWCSSTRSAPRYPASHPASPFPPHPSQGRHKAPMVSLPHAPVRPP